MEDNNHFTERVSADDAQKKTSSSPFKKMADTSDAASTE